MSLTKLTRGSGAGGAYIAGDKWGYQEAEGCHASINSLAGRRVVLPLLVGGGRADLHENSSAAAFDHPNWWDVAIDWTEMASGWTVVARVEVYTSSASCSITPRIRNITDSVNTDGTSSSTVGWVEKNITIPVPGVLGVKKYRLQLIPGLANTGVNAVGVVEIYG